MRLPGLRGPLRDALHRDHRGGVQPAGERAVRRALPRHRGQRAARAARPPGRRPRRDRARDRRRRRRQLGRAGRARRGPGQRRPQAPRVPARRRSRARCSRAARAAAPFVPSQPDLRGRALAHPVSPRAGSAEAWLVVVRRSGELGDFERLCVQQAAIVVALELMRERVARETERRLSGEVLAATFPGGSRPTTFATGSRPSASASGRWCWPSSSMTPPPPSRPSPSISRARAARPWSRRTPRAARAPLRGGRRCEGRPSPARERGTRRRWRRRTAPRAPPPAARCPPSGCATPSTRLAAPSRRPASPTAPLPRSPRYRDLGAFTLLLSVQDGEALRLYCESVLGPIEDSDERYAGELLRSLEAYIDRNGHWERAAATATATGIRSATGSSASRSSPGGI